jgi:hypothetical protein
MNPKSAIEDHSLGRWPYFWWGCGLMATKYNIDRAVAWFGFHRPWYFWNYVRPHGFAPVDAIPPDDESFYLILLLTSLPFLVLGIFLTLRRLRSAGLPLILCLLFFAPVINLIFFLTLCLAPEKQSATSPTAKRRWETYLPTSAVGSSLLSVVIVGTLGVALTCFSTHVLQNYGWGLFVGQPFAMGLVSVLIFSWQVKRSFTSCLGVAALTAVFVGLCLFVIALEGAICLIMAAPIGVGLAVLGGMVGYMITDTRHSIRPAQVLLILLAVPLTMGMESTSDETPPLLAVTSSVVIDARPEQVWPNVISFSSIPESPDWILRTGVAYPNRARIDGSGVGAIRHCIFTTGEFVEPIRVWDENRLLQFSVAAQPEPMEELSPYPHLKTPHLHGYLESHQGELRLTELPGGKTLLQGTTWYTDKIWPSAYWQLWSDLIIHHIHLRVLNHIKILSESEGPR